MHPLDPVCDHLDADGRYGVDCGEDANFEDQAKGRLDPNIDPDRKPEWNETNRSEAERGETMRGCDPAEVVLARDRFGWPRPPVEKSAWRQPLPPLMPQITRDSRKTEQESQRRWDRDGKQYLMLHVRIDSSRAIGMMRSRQGGILRKQASAVLHVETPGPCLMQTGFHGMDDCFFDEKYTVVSI